jgi:hypothetical protein
MNHINQTTLPLPKPIEDRCCAHCGGKSWLALRLLDPIKGRMIRISRCECGKEIWSSELE